MRICANNTSKYCKRIGNPVPNPRQQGAAFGGAPKGRRASHAAPLGFIVLYLVHMAVRRLCRCAGAPEPETLEVHLNLNLYDLFELFRGNLELVRTFFGAPEPTVTTSPQQSVP